MIDEEFDMSMYSYEDMERDMPLIIQGPTTYCREVSNYYKNYNQVWSTWNSEPEENLEFLSKQKNVRLVLDDLPVIPESKLKNLTEHAVWTLQRSTYQFTSTLNGFKYADKNFGAYFAPKIRSDFLIDVATATHKSNPGGFNCLGWHNGSVGYLIDYYFMAPVHDVIRLMEGCISLSHPSHSENVMTYFLLEKMKQRNIAYCFDSTVYTYSLKHKYDTELFLGEITKGKWLIDENQKHTSKNYKHTFEKDNLPDVYPLTYGWGPGV